MDEKLLDRAIEVLKPKLVNSIFRQEGKEPEKFERTLRELIKKHEIYLYAKANER